MTVFWTAVLGGAVGGVLGGVLGGLTLVGAAAVALAPIDRAQRDAYGDGI